MASIMELLERLNIEEAAVPTADLASKLKASKEGTLKQLNREKDKGRVDGNSKEGWLITESGRKALEQGGIHPSMIDEGVTPRQQFEAIGQRIGIKEDRIVLAADIVWSGDFDDVQWVWQALGQAAIANDLRTVWVNAWRAKLHKAIPPELETELAGVSKPAAEEGKDGAPSKQDRAYIIVDDEPVRVGENLGDYSLQDAKDILSIRAVRNRFSGVRQQDAGSPPGATEKLSELLTALAPYINKGSNGEALKEMLADKLQLQRQEILSHIPQAEHPAQPKSFMDQITELVAAMGSLKEIGPTLRSILGVPESSGNPASNPDSPIDERLKWRKFLVEERRSNERHDALMALSKTVRENVSDGVSAITAAAAEVKKTGKAATQEEAQVCECNQCHTQFRVPQGDYQRVSCPSCHAEYTREEVMSA